MGALISPERILPWQTLTWHQSLPGGKLRGSIFRAIQTWRDGWKKAWRGQLTSECEIYGIVRETYFRYGGVEQQRAEVTQCSPTGCRIRALTNCRPHPAVAFEPSLRP